MSAKRTVNLTEFATLLESKFRAIAKETGTMPRVYRINSPESRGDIEVVLDSNETVRNRTAITFRADGTWSGISYWAPDQI